MPVYLEIINQPDAADMADLEKVYSDYALPPVASLADWLFDQREAGKTLIVGRFNGRLLAALWLGQDGLIEHLCVRSVTRRRGTARQLLQVLQQLAGQMKVEQLRAAAEPEMLAPLWKELGFQLQGTQWIWQR